MSWLNDDSNNILALGKMSSGLLGVLDAYREGKRIKLTEKDQDNLDYAITFFTYAIEGCESLSDPKKLFNYDENFPATPASALRLTFEIVEGAQKDSNITDIQKFCNEYKEVLIKIQKNESFVGKNIKRNLDKTISFFDGLEKKADIEISQKVYSATSASSVSNFWTPI
jgi:hypothetical protein